MNVNVVINFQETIYENNQKDVHNKDLTADVLLHMSQKMIMMEKMT